MLDIGGEARPVKGRTKSWEVDNYEVLDMPRFNIEKPSDFVSYRRSADYIFVLEVFEYLIEPKKAMQTIRNCLKADGKAYLSAPQIYPTHEELNLDSLRYTEFGLLRLAQSAGLILSHVWYRIDRTGHLKMLYTIDGMRASKNYSHHDATGFIVELTK